MTHVNADAAPVQCTIADGIATLVLDRPDALNAMSVELVAAVNTALDRLADVRPRPRCLLLTGNGRAFCAGGDISAHLNRPPDAEPYDLGRVLHELFNPLLMRSLRLRIPLVIAVNGPAAGAGCQLALCGDVVLAAGSASFECGFARIGLMPDLGATWLLPRLIGRARAHAMMMLDQRVSAATAESWGMIYACVPDTELQMAALEIARKLASGPTEALVATRKAILSASATSLPEALDAEAEAQRALGGSAEFSEGIAAFFARRAPEFRRA
jgi:2-(1,2-epoxy-1,2-dihydrophenyl)acetyl-CoA isomerase